MFISIVPEISSYQCLKPHKPLLPNNTGSVVYPLPPQSSRIPYHSPGTSTCPWRIRTSPGRRFNLTAYIFGSYTQQCTTLLFISEQNGDSRSFSLCPDVRGRRFRKIAISKSHEVSFHLRGAMNGDARVLVHYEGKSYQLFSNTT